MSSKYLVRLEEIVEEARALGAEFQELSEKDELTEEEETRFGLFVGDDETAGLIDQLKSERADVQKRLSILAAAEEVASTEIGEDRGAPRQMKRTETDVDIRTANAGEVRSAAMARLAQEHNDQMVGVSDDAAAHIENMFGRRSRNIDGELQFDGDALARRLLATETPAYRSAWQKSMRHPNPAFTPEEVEAVNYFRAAEQSLTSASGGFGVPVLIDPTIILTSGGAAAPLLEVSRIEQITNNIWKGVSSAGVAFAAHTEGTAVTAGQATLAQPTITPETAALYVPFSVEIEGDYPNFAMEMQSLIEVAYIDYVGAQTATGAAGLVGIFTAIDLTAGSEVNPTTDGALGPEDALVVWNALPERARSRANWFMNVSVESKLRTGADGYGTRNLSSDGIGPLLGKRVLLSDYAPAFSGTTGAANLAILGDFQKFVIAQRVGMSIEFIPHIVDGSGIPTLQRGWVAWARVGSDSVDDDSFVLLQNA